jgi:hypothetical protein
MIHFDCPGNQQVRLHISLTNQDGSDAPLEPSAISAIIRDGLGTFDYNPATNGFVFRLESNPVSDPLLFFPLTHYELTVTMRFEGRALPPT